MPRVGWFQRNSASKAAILLSLEIDDRLIIELKFTGADGVAQVEFKLAPGLYLGVHFGLEEAENAATVGLGPV